MPEEHKTEHKAHEEHKVEHVSHEEHKKQEQNVWRYTTIALMIVVVLLLVAFLWTGESSSTSNLPVASQNQIATKSVDFINKNIISGGNGNATVGDVNESSGILNVTVLYNGNRIPVYATTDGKYLIIPGMGVIDMDTPLPTRTEPIQTQQYSPQKTDKPVAQLFVMAFCPYGMQAEDAMKPVVDLLGAKADIQVHFIATVGGTTPDSVSSLHGAPEAQEDLRQVCIMKYYDQKTYWNYMITINDNCSSSYRDTAAYDTCWKNAATKADIDSSKIAACANSTEGVNLVKADADLSSANGVSGSPTLIVSGATYNNARTPDAYKDGICQAFNTAPTECSQTLSTTTTTASGNCG